MENRGVLRHEPSHRRRRAWARWFLPNADVQERFMPLPIGLPHHCDGLHRGNLRAASEAEALTLAGGQGVEALEAISWCQHGQMNSRQAFLESGQLA